MSWPAVDVTAFRDAMANVAMPVAVITVRAGRETRGVTVGSLISLSLDPPLVLFALHRSSSMLAPLGHGSFAITVLSDAQPHVASLLARPGRPPVPPAWTCPAGDDDAPGLRGGAASMRATTCGTWQAGDHVVVVARVLSIAASRRAPLLYHRRAYRTVGAPAHPPQGTP